jgi:hypothetical protein
MIGTAVNQFLSQRAWLQGRRSHNESTEVEFTDIRQALLLDEMF